MYKITLKMWPKNLSILVLPFILSFVSTMTQGVEKIDKEMTRYGPTQYTNEYHHSHYPGPMGVGGSTLLHRHGHGQGHGGVSFSMDPTNGLVVVIAIVVIVTLCGILFTSVGRRGGGGYGGGGGGWGSPYGRTLLDRNGEMMTAQVLSGVEQHYDHTAPYNHQELAGI